MDRESLLSPSLSADDATLAPPSAQSMFLTSFFGGPGAAVAIIAVGSYRLRRLVRDLPLLLLLLIGPLGLIVWLQNGEATAAAREWLSDTLGNSAFTYVNRATALVCFAAGYTMHRQAHRHSDLLGLKRPNGWIVGLSCIAIGFSLTFGTFALVRALTEVTR
ncbi:MAG TPA: hypothetical protein VK629_09385 [Steroidobacteraceae bacterium]|nr:hypothetical protein [Steroidobacteraceae bacterium]